MIELIKTDSSNEDFIGLVKYLDLELEERDGDEHPFYAQFNKIDMIRYVIVAYAENRPVSCGAIKEYDAGTMEIKRMYTLPEYRGKGIASKVLKELERWTADLSYKKCILETGKKQPEAIRLYTKNGYRLVPNYGQYAEADNSLCFEKVLIKGRKV